MTAGSIVGPKKLDTSADPADPVDLGVETLWICQEMFGVLDLLKNNPPKILSLKCKAARL